MANKDFFDAIFPKDFWQSMDRSIFVEDEHSMFGDAEVFDFLIDRMRPSTIIEVGSWKGHSANHMADACKRIGISPRIVCVDTFLGGPEHWLLPHAFPTLHRKNGRPSILERFLGNTAARGNEDAIFPFTLSSDAAARVLAHFGFQADLIFIDAGHSYPDVVRDITNFGRLLSSSGVMFGDDYQSEEVAKAAHDCASAAGAKLMVIDRKWIYLNEALLKRISNSRAQLRDSFDGWIHP